MTTQIWSMNELWVGLFFPKANLEYLTQHVHKALMAKVTSQNYDEISNKKLNLNKERSSVEINESSQQTWNQGTKLETEKV